MKLITLSVVAVAISCVQAFSAEEFKQAPLPYATDALEPFIDKATMEIHYGRHHAAYVKNLNAQIASHPELAELSLEAVQEKMSTFSTAVRNNGGGHFNHQFFWQIMAPQDQCGQPGAELEEAVRSEFGSIDQMKDRFNQAALSRFGSGWVWLIVTPEGKLQITTTANQDNPLMDIPEIERGTPILALDVWEHAYYLKYQNKRGDYAANWWNVVNWNEVNKRFEAAAE